MFNGDRGPVWDQEKVLDMMMVTGAQQCEHVIHGTVRLKWLR